MLPLPSVAMSYLIFGVGWLVGLLCLWRSVRLRRGRSASARRALLSAGARTVPGEMGLLLVPACGCWGLGLGLALLAFQGASPVSRAIGALVVALVVLGALLALYGMITFSSKQVVWLAPGWAKPVFRGDAEPPRLVATVEWEAASSELEAALRGLLPGQVLRFDDPLGSVAVAPLRREGWGIVAGMGADWMPAAWWKADGFTPATSSWHCQEQPDPRRAAAAVMTTLRHLGVATPGRPPVPIPLGEGAPEDASVLGERCGNPTP